MNYGYLCFEGVGRLKVETVSCLLSRCVKHTYLVKGICYVAVQ